MTKARENRGATLTNTGRKAPVGAVSARPMLFLVLDASSPTALPVRWRLDQLSSLVIGRSEGTRTKSMTADKTLTVGLPDPYLSTTHAIIDRGADDTIVLRDARSKNGTFVNNLPVTTIPLKDRDVVEIGRSFFVFRTERTVADTDPVAADLDEFPREADELATMVPELQRDFAKLRPAVRGKVPVLVEGETGTGKELVARAVHRMSKRAGEFVAVNCGAIPPNLVESVLFGHRKGAFSGAVEDQTGLVRSADKGVLFLDEIGEMPPNVQTAFLRVLETRSVTPVGSSKAVPVDFQLVSATNRDLSAMCASGAFREDLFARIDGLRLRLPPLADRREDLGVIIFALLREVAPDRATRVHFTPDAARALIRHDYPRNIRQLRTALQSALAAADGDVIDAGHLPDSLQPSPGAAVDMPVEGTEARLRMLLEEHRGNLSAVARALKRDRTQVKRWLKAFAIDADEYRDE